MRKQRRRSAAQELTGDQLTGDQHLCFRHKGSSRVPLRPKFQASSIPNLVRNPEDMFSHNAAHLETQMLKTVPKQVSITRFWFQGQDLGKGP